ncbi:MAG TPA: hypothetical protein VGB75_20065 [Jatrophihabitans sp.]
MTDTALQPTQDVRGARTHRDSSALSLGWTWIFSPASALSAAGR